MIFTFNDLFLLKKPGQYLNQELNSAVKRNAEVKAVLIYPDLYEVGFPNIGLQILYHLGNSLEWASCERAYAPGEDAKQIINKKKETLFSIETCTPLKFFDVVGFTLQSELTYTTLLDIIKLSGLPLYSETRKKPFPLVIAGGPGAFNPSPLSPFIDVFIVGDGERAFLTLLEVVREAKKGSVSKKELLNEVEERVDGAYIPSHYKEIFDEKGFLREIIRVDGVEKKTRKAVLPSISNYELPVRQLVPNIQVAHERAQVEIARGCLKGCRFCQAGFIYRPTREQFARLTHEKAIKTLQNTGFEELGFVSLSTSDYTALDSVLETLIPYCEKRHVSVSLPSLRMDSFTREIALKIARIKRTGITFAPEAGSERLRRTINKKLDDKDIDNALQVVFSSGWQKIKLYFMIGLPTETDEDLDGIADVMYRALKAARENLPGRMFSRVNIGVSISTFVPKAHTPFQWERQIRFDEALRKKQYLLERVKKRQFKINFHNPRMAEVEGLISRGDIRVATLIKKASEMGAIFDGWKEKFDYNIWWKAAGDYFDRYLRERSEDEVLPWSVIDSLVSESYLRKERKRAYLAKETMPCLETCRSCGVCSDDICVLTAE